jgi:hypothetical protein
MAFMSSKSSEYARKWLIFAIIFSSTMLFSMGMHNIDTAWNAYKLAAIINHDTGSELVDISQYHDCNGLTCWEYPRIYSLAITMLLIAWMLMFGTMLWFALCKKYP